MVQGRILRKSWPLSETAWPHIAILHRLEDPAGSAQKPGSGKKSKGKDRRKTAGSIQPQSTPVQPVGVGGGLVGMCVGLIARGFHSGFPGWSWHLHRGKILAFATPI